MTTRTVENSVGPAFEALLTEGRARHDSGDFDGAVALFEEAAKLAETHRDHESRLRARCDRASVLVTLGKGRDVASELRTILMGSASDRTRSVAAAALAIHHDIEDTLPRARFYSQLSLDHARKSGDPRLIARAGNRLGNMLVAESYFEEAAASYEEALETIPMESSVDRALLLANLGYCSVVREQVRRGFGLLFSALRMMRRLGQGPWEVRSRVRLSICLGYLELERYDRARVHGERGLAAAEEIGDSEAVKKALYLLGELEKLDGRRLVAYSYFARLRDEFLPASIGLPDMLMATDTHKMINLMA